MALAKTISNCLLFFLVATLVTLSVGMCSAALVARSAYERATGTIAPAAIDTVPPSEAPTVISPVPTIGSD